jgi:hypothetical protein
LKRYRKGSGITFAKTEEKSQQENSKKFLFLSLLGCWFWRVGLRDPCSSTRAFFLNLNGFRLSNTEQRPYVLVMEIESQTIFSEGAIFSLKDQKKKLKKNPYLSSILAKENVCGIVL